MTRDCSETSIFPFFVLPCTLHCVVKGLKFIFDVSRFLISLKKAPKFVSPFFGKGRPGRMIWNANIFRPLILFFFFVVSNLEREIEKSRTWTALGSVSSRSMRGMKAINFYIVYSQYHLCLDFLWSEGNHLGLVIDQKTKQKEIIRNICGLHSRAQVRHDTRWKSSTLGTERELSMRIACSLIIIVNKQ